MADNNAERRKTFEQWQAFEEKQQQREMDDLSFYEGEGQWPKDIRDAREGKAAVGGMPAVPGRPMITVNKVREPIRHVVNEERSADLGVEIVSAEDAGQPGISKEELELREGLVRRIQRESHAIDARIWAAERAAIAGRGYYGVMTRYLPGKTNDQEIYVRRVYDQGSILIDPAHEEPDGSDAEGAFVPVWMPWEQYRKTYPKRAGNRTNTAVQMGEADFKTLSAKLTDWFSTQNDSWRVRVVERWYYERDTRLLVVLKNGMVGWDDELEGKYRDLIVDDREVVDKQVKFCMFDGFDDDKSPLEETDWPGKFIPIIKVVGEEIQPFDSQRRFEGMVRPSRDPQQGFNIMISKWVEMIGITPVPPLMMTPQHIEGFTDMYDSMATRNWPYLPYNDVDPATGRQLPPPVRPPVATDIQAIAGSVQLFDQAIKSTTAIPDATLGNVDPTVRSGKGIQALALNALKATAHFGDNFERSVNYEGRIINDLLEPIYGRRPGRNVQTYTKDRSSKSFAIGAPGQQGVPTLTPDTQFAITVKVTKNYNTLREQEASTIQEAVGQAPEFWLPLIADKLFEYQDGSGHDALAERGEFGLRPDVRAMIEAKKSGQPMPNPQMQQLLAENQQLKQLVQGKGIEQQAKLQQIQVQEQHEDQRTAAEIQAGITKTEIQASATMAVAQQKVDAENFRSYVDALEGRIAKTLDLHLEKVTQAVQHQHEARTQVADQQHEMRMAQLEHAQALQQGAQQHQQALQQGVAGHAQALQQGEQAHAQNLEQGQQDAALTSPTEGN